MDPQLFTAWQRRVLANALVALAILFIVTLICGGVLAAGLVMARLKTVLIPVAVGALLAYLLMPPVDWLHQKRGWSRGAAVWTVFGVGGVVTVALGSLILPAMLQELADFAQKIPAYFQRAATAVTSFIEEARQAELPTAWQETVNAVVANAKASLPELAKNLSQKLPDLLSGAVGWFGAIVGFLIIPVYVYYFLRDPEFFATNWQLYVPVAHATVRQDVIRLVRDINDSVKAFFRGQCLVAACVGALAAVGFYIARIDFALLLGLWVGVFDLIPFFGVIAGAVPAMLIAYAQHDDWQHPLAAAGVCVGVHVIENMLLAPKIVGQKTGLHPVAVVLSILIWGKLLGFIGVLLAVPLTSTLKVLFQHYLWQRLPKS